MRYVCKNCNYRFNSEIKEAKKRCPYCGKLEAEKEQSAEELIE